MSLMSRLNLQRSQASKELGYQNLKIDEPPGALPAEGGGGDSSNNGREDAGAASEGDTPRENEHNSHYITNLHSAPNSASPPPPDARAERRFRIGQGGSRPRRRYARWYKCACGFCVLSCMLLCILAIAALCFYAIVHPRSPAFQVKDVAINSMVLTPSNASTTAGVPPDYAYDSALDLGLLFTLDVHNPNSRISVEYTKFRIDVSYQGLRLASGYVAPFALGRKQRQDVLAEIVSTGIGLQHLVATKLSADMSLDSVPLVVDLAARTRLKVMRSVVPVYTTRMSCRVGLSPPTGPTGPELLYKSCKFSRPSSKV